MNQLIKLSESTAARRRIAIRCVSDADGRSPLTGLTFSGAEIKVGKSDGSEASFAGSVTEIAGGMYYYEPTTGEIDTLGFGYIRWNKTDVLQDSRYFQIVAFDPYSATNLGLSVITNIQADTDDIQTKIGTPAGASLSADIAVIEAQTDDIGVAGAGLTAIPWNTSWDAEVQSEAADALIAYDPPTHTELIAEIDAVQTDIAGVQSDTNDIQTRLPATLVGGKMDSDMTAISGDTAAADNLEKEYDGTGFGDVLQRTTIATLASQVSFTLTAGSADDNAYNYCVAVIEDASTAAQKAVAVIDDYTGSSKTITLKNDPGIFTMAVGDIVSIIADKTIKPTADNRFADVSTGGEVGIDWANIGSPTTVQGLSGTTIKEVTDVQTKLGTPAGASVSADIAAIEAQTDDIGSGGAGLTSIPWNSAWDVEVESEVTDGLNAYDPPTFAELDARTDAIDAAIAAIQADTDNIQTRLPSALVGGKMDSDMTAISGDTAAADNAEKYFDGTGYGEILHRTTIATVASQSQITLSTGSSDDDAYKYSVVVIEDASTAVQKCVTSAGTYTGSTKILFLSTATHAFTIAVGDIVTILADKSLKPNPDNLHLDISAFGTAGLDWANISGATTANNFTNTTIKTATDVETDTQNIQSRLPAALTGAGNIKAETLVISADAINEAAFADDTDIYHADINFTRDEANTQDEYSVRWFKNGIRITAGITLAKIQVVKRSDGSDLVAETAMTEIGSTHAFKYDEDTNRLSLGEAYEVIAKATINSSVRTFAKVVARDSA